MSIIQYYDSGIQFGVVQCFNVEIRWKGFNMGCFNISMWKWDEPMYKGLDQPVRVKIKRYQYKCQGYIRIQRLGVQPKFIFRVFKYNDWEFNQNDSWSKYSKKWGRIWVVGVEYEFCCLWVLWCRICILFYGFILFALFMS